MSKRSASGKGRQKRAGKREKRLVTLMPQTLLVVAKIILWFVIEENHHR